MFICFNVATESIIEMSNFKTIKQIIHRELRNTKNFDMYISEKKQDYITRREDHFVLPNVNNGKLANNS